jgi:hypothetical protein
MAKYSHGSDKPLNAIPNIKFDFKKIAQSSLALELKYSHG